MNNAGILGRLGPPEWIQIEDYKKVLGVNLLGLIDVTITFLPLVKKARGRIVNTSSVSGRIASPNGSAYCVSKYGIEAFSDVLRRWLAAYKVHVALIEPGSHGTPLIAGRNIEAMFEEAWSSASADVKEEFGEEFFRKEMSTFSGTIDLVRSPRISNVVDAYEHALLGRFPRARYLVGYDARFLWIPIQWLPEWLGDWVLDVLSPNKAIPAALKKRQ